MNVRTSGIVVLLVVFFSGMLVACGSGEEADGEGGGETGRISLYSPETPDMTRQLAEAFEEEYGGTVDVNYAGTNVLVNQMIAEMDNPQADLWYGGGGILPFEAAIERGFIEAYTPEMAEDWETYEDGIKLRHEDWMWVGTEVLRG
jgi:iron(III) transport system substrate-binding protein